MYTWIADFPLQVEDAVRIGKDADIQSNIQGVQNIVLTGMGGSAIGGDLLRSYLADEFKVHFRPCAAGNEPQLEDKALK